LEKTPRNLRLVSKDDLALEPPRPLGPHGRGLWDSILSENTFDDSAGREMLYHACAALDRAEHCAEIINAEGAVVRSKTGVREHPALRPELANRAFVARTLVRLGLIDEALKPIGRPPTKVGA
jgi:hypothetical protein